MGVASAKGGGDMVRARWDGGGAIVINKFYWDAFTGGEYMV